MDQENLIELTAEEMIATEGGSLDCYAAAGILIGFAIATANPFIGFGGGVVLGNCLNGA